MPYHSFHNSAHVLDWRRLGKQRVEVLQMLRAIDEHQRGGASNRLINHPATKMWLDFPQALMQYGLTICEEWENRGYEDTVADQIRDVGFLADEPIEMPPWLGDERLHANHRSRLLEKQYDHYTLFGWSEKPVVNNLWPILQPDGSWQLVEYVR